METVKNSFGATEGKSADRFTISEWITIAIVLLALILSIYISFFPEKQKKISIIASVLPSDENYWEIRGRVHIEGKPIDSARVWVVLKDNQNNEDSPPAVFTNQQGEFYIDSIPRNLGISSKPNTEPADKTNNSNIDSEKGAESEKTNKVKVIKIYASKIDLCPSNEEELIEGEKTLTTTGEGVQKTIGVRFTQLVFLLTIFLMSIIIPFLRISPRLKYSISIILAFLFSVAIIAAISKGIYFVSNSDKTEVLTLGFSHIFWGTYATGVQPEWLFSLTSPVDVSAGIANSGFGAPLWVLLLSVIGSSLFTVLIIVSEIKKRPDFNKLSKQTDKSKDKSELENFRDKLENIVLHQFYLLFSPLGAIFVYQLLILADVAMQPITVAIAALGAGSTLNLLLDKAVLASKKAFGKTETEEEEFEKEKSD